MAEDNSVLDEIMSDAATTLAAPETTTDPTPTPEPAPQSDEQPRGPDGKFAPKADEPAPAEPATPPADDPATATPSGSDGKTVPLSAHIAQREELGGKLDEAMRQIQQLTGQVQLLSQRPAAQPAQAQEQQKPREIWEDPDGYTTDRVNAAVTPVLNTMQQFIGNISYREAVREFGADTVKTAAETLKSAVANGLVDGREIQQRLGASMDPIGDTVRWYRQQEALKRVGDDPDKFIESEMEKRMSDPAFQAEFIKRIQSGAAANVNAKAGQQPPVTLPPSLTRLPGGANQAADTDVSSEALFNFATGT